MATNYEVWIKQYKRREKMITYIVRFAVLVIFFSLGMFTQYYMHDAQEIKQSVSHIESMPDPTEAQKAAARNRLKRVTPEYLKERLGNK